VISCEHAVRPPATVLQRQSPHPSHVRAGGAIGHPRGEVDLDRWPHGPGSVPPACVMLSCRSHASPSLPLRPAARMARPSAPRPVPAASARRCRPNRTSPRPRPRAELALPRGAEWPRGAERVGHDTAGVMGRPGLQLVARWYGYRNAKSRVSEVSGSERSSAAAALVPPGGRVSGR